MQIQDVILRPVITEQSMYDLEEKKYTFEVDRAANKPLIKKAVEAMFEGVEVAKVNTINVDAKSANMGMYRGKKRSYKKAIVKLTENSADIDLFGEDEE